MDRDAILQSAAQSMLRQLGDHALRRAPHVRTVSYPQPPLILSPREDNLHLVRRPEIDITADEAIVVFAQAIEALLGNDTTALFRAVGGPASKMIRRFSALPSQVVALLWYLGGAENATLDYDDNMCMLQAPEDTVGIYRGVIKNRFIEQHIGEVNPRQVLVEGGEDCRSTEPLFVVAYGMARRHSRDLATGMAVLYQATTPQRFKQYVMQPPRLLSSQCQKLEDEIMGAKDPLLKLYKALVPRWMQPSEFGRTFGLIETRDLDPDVTRRSVLLNKLVMQDFYRRDARPAS